MSTSKLCKSNNCVTRVGSSGSSNADAVTTVIDAFATELDFNEFTLNSIVDLNQSARSGQVFRQENTITRLIREYGETSFYQSVAGFNNYFNRPEIRNLVNAERYPNVFERINSGVIFTPIEVAEFTYQYQYTPINLTTQTSIISPKLLNEVEEFYAKNISQGIIGKFCALMPNVFAAVGAFFTFIDNVEGFINDIKKFASALEGGISGLLAGLVDRIKSQVLQVVDRVVEKVKGIIENFSIENIAQEVKTFVDQKIIGRFYELREQALSFFNEFNIENLKKKIEALVDYAGGLFKDPTLEEIQFLIYRFCNLASQIEKGVGSLINPLRDYANNYRDTVETLRAASNRNTSRAVAAGAIRLTPTARDAAVNSARDGRIPSGGGSSVPDRIPLGDIRPVTQEELANVTPWNNGNGDARIGFTGSVQSLEWKWTDTSIESRALIVRVQRRFGRRILVLSGRRSYEEQFALYQRDLERNSGSPSGRVAKPGFSKHESGHAFDITWPGFNRETGRQFLQIAVEEGFFGIGGYPRNSFVHIDRGPARSWGDTFGVVPGGPVNSSPPGEPPNTPIPPTPEETDQELDGATGAGTQSNAPEWTEDDARNVETLRGTGDQLPVLTEGEKAYADSQGYSNNPALVTTSDETSTTTRRVSPINEAVPLSPERARTRLGSQRLAEGRQYVVEGKVYTAQRLGPLGFQPDAPIRLVDDRGIPGSF